MSGFSADWLALRAAADDRARDRGLLRTAADLAKDGMIVDLGGGAGATWRALAPLVPDARWRVLDDDPALLALLPGAVEGVEVDLAASPEAAFAPALRLVTASAFFDLVSAAWIERFCDLLAASGAALYAALTYDGREDWRPAPPGKAEALAAFHRDMRRDKGFGPALGPAAHDALAVALRTRGYAVREASSDWRLSRPQEARLIETLARGAEDAVTRHINPARGWAAACRNAETVMIGHRDLIAVPPRR